MGRGFRTTSSAQYTTLSREQEMDSRMVIKKEIENDVVMEIDESLGKRILKSVINDYLAWPPGNEHHNNARLWLFTDFEETEEDRTENDKEGFVSLFTVCELLDIDHEKLRVSVKCKEDKGNKRVLFNEFDVLLHSCRR